MNATTAREHAIRASELLNSMEQRIPGLDPSSPTLGIALAQAHGMVALALCMTDEDPDPDDATERFS